MKGTPENRGALYYAEKEEEKEEICCVYEKGGMLYQYAQKSYRRF